ncbi:MAG: hypothetical protein JXB46_05265 [Candidatus Eisenbacteria bacterium]|nr:hypothetical protein [Candidatus Eisenbacteria bacterium]
MGRVPDFKHIAEEAHARLGRDGALELLDAGRHWRLAPILEGGGAVIFPHVSIGACGHLTAAAVHACLDSGAEKILALGVLHALTDELETARRRVAEGRDPAAEKAWGIQGPGVDGRDDWKDEFSLSHFLFLFEVETARRGVRSPELVLRYPYLAGGQPHLLPGIRELEEVARGAAVVATADPFHHGIGYGDPPDKALSPDGLGLATARRRINEGLELLRAGDHWGYNRHCVHSKSDARDVGQVLRHLLGPFNHRIIEIVADDMSGAYGAPAPTWVAGALIELMPE